MSVSKAVDRVEDALDGLEDGATVLAGGFGVCGIPETAIEAVCARGTRRLTVVSNNCGLDDVGLGVLLHNRQIAKMISSYVGGNREFARQMLAGELEVDLVPQGTLAERLRAGGAGIPAFYTPTGAGTQVAENRETRVFDGVPNVLERAITGDFALVKAWKGDALGNLVYRRTARNFNPLIAMAGRVTIAEVEELVEPGELDPDAIHTPGVFVQHVCLAQQSAKRIERVVVASGMQAADV
jgi:3-oxoacid CoA-transferase subunit A